MITLRQSVQRPDAGIMRSIADIPTADIADILRERISLTDSIRPLFDMAPFAGPALTIETTPNDNLAIFAALELVRPGDVLVVATGDFVSAATIGDTFMALCAARGVAAVVTDGLVRDVERMRRIGLPVLARGRSPIPPRKAGPGRVGFDIVIGGVAVRAGDVIVSDADGVVVVPAERAQELLDRQPAPSTATTPAARQDSLPEWLVGFLQGDGVERV